MIQGVSGCGKTALMCKAAYQTKEAHPQSVVIARLLGTTGDSGAARATLTSLCQQLCRAYDKDGSQVSAGWEQVVWKECSSP